MNRNFTMMMFMQMEPGGGPGQRGADHCACRRASLARFPVPSSCGHVFVKLTRGQGDSFGLCCVEDAGLAVADVAWRRRGGRNVGGTGLQEVVVRK